MSKRKEWIGRLAAGFFVLMIICTAVSRAAAAAIVPIVTTANVKEGKMTVKVDGTGVIEAKKTRMVALPENIRVQETKKVGEQVKKGEALLICDTEYLEERLVKMRAEIKKVQLQLESQEVSGRADARVSASESARRAWNRACEDVSEADEDYEDASEDARTGKEKWKKKLDEAKKAAKEKRTQTEQEAEKKLQTVLAGIETQRAELKAGQQQTEKTDGQVTGAEAGTAAADDSSMQLQKLQEQEDEARKEYSECLERAAGEYDQEIAAAKQEYQAALAELENQKSAAKEKKASTEDVLQQAQDELELAQMSDAADGQNQEKADAINALDQETTKIDLELLENDLEKLEKLQNSGGIVTAPKNGVVEKNPVEAGTVTTGQEVILLGYGGYQIKGELQEDDLSKIQEGDVVKVSVSGRADEIEAMVERVQSMEDDRSFTAAVDEKNLAVGLAVSYCMEKETDTSYEMRIPLGALREDEKGTYCLMLTENSTVLGMEYTASRVNVTVQEKDETYAAITGNLSRDDEIITGSNKSITEGDRVRKEV